MADNPPSPEDSDPGAWTVFSEINTVFIDLNQLFRNFSVQFSSMEAVRSFYSYLRRFIDLSEEEFAHHLEPVIKVRRFGKREKVTRAGEIEDNFNFIAKGLVRKYYCKGNQEINTQISFEGHLIL